VNRFEVSRGVVLESPAITGEVPEQQLPKTSSARNAKLPVRKGERSTRSGNPEAQRLGKSRRTRKTRISAEDSAATPADITGSVTARSSLGRDKRPQGSASAREQGRPLRVSRDTGASSRQIKAST